MSRDKDPECCGYLVAETDAAMEVSTDPCGAGPRWWIPRSQVGYLRKTYNADKDCTELVLTLPEWLIEKKQCWELVP